jgi:hypothetical protein
MEFFKNSRRPGFDIGASNRIDLCIDGCRSLG